MPLLLSARSFEVNQSGFYKDGEIYRIFSGSMHYARVPEAAWEDRLIKARAMGLNTISTPVFWNFHEPEEGFFDFTTGRRNLRKFIELADFHGLNVILKPGPYVSAEWDMGGIPHWLLAKENVKFRSDDKQFLDYTRRYLLALAEAIRGLQVAEGGPVILMQVENEYGSFGNDKGYLENILALYKDSGFTVPFFTTDAGEYQRLEAGALEDIFPTVRFTRDAEENFEVLGQFDEGQAHMAGEFRIGRATYWDDSSRKDTRRSLLLKDLKWMLENDKSFDLYPFHGGTNFGFQAGAHFSNGEYLPVTTSHDFGAPLAEDGTITKEYKKIRKLLKKYQNLSDNPMPEIPKDPKTGKVKKIRFKLHARLLRNLPDDPTVTSMPLPMEQYGMNSGMIVYKTTLRGQKRGTMVIEAPHDIAHVYLNEKHIRTLYRNEKKFVLEIPSVKGSESPELVIIVESLGRISLGPELMDKKGITKYVTLNDVNVMNWEVTPIPFNEEYLASLNYHDDMIYQEPAFFASTFKVVRPGDIKLRIGKWSSGIIVINGKIVGRYRDRSPQKELFVPGSWLNSGINTIYLLDMGMEYLPNLSIE